MVRSSRPLNKEGQIMARGQMLARKMIWVHAR
jgi:hypothetical protein